MPSKSIFRQPGAKHFQLVHRSQRDPLIHDPDASQHVFKPFERENTKKGKSRADLETLLSPSDLENDKNSNVGEAAIYGIYYDDTSYNYMQHLRTVGTQEDGVDSILIEAPLPKKNRSNKTTGKLVLPQEVLPSASELPRTYESQEAVPTSIAGFQPDMDLHLRQVLEALEDDAFVDDDLHDGFFEELIESGERASDDEVKFEPDVTNPEIMEGDNSDTGDWEESMEREMGWEERFAKFKKNQARKEQDIESDDELLSEGGDTIRGLPSISVIGGKGKKRRKGSSDASGYSMSSSSMYRNEALQTLDERFDQIMEKEYHEENDEEEAPVPSDEEENDETPELITSREDFNTMLNEFLNDYEILGRKMKPKLAGDTAIDKLNTIRRALGHDNPVQVANGDDDDIQDLLALDESSKEDRWDCETILTTYSNLDNHPRLIRVSKSKTVPKITLDPRTGLPLINGPPDVVARKNAPSTDDNEDRFDDAETENTVRKRATVSRPRDESKEERKERKSEAKKEKQIRRMEKRAMKEKFGTELKNQKQMLASTTQRVKKL